MIKAGLRRVPKFEEVLGKDTYDLDERLKYLGNAAKSYREGFFFTRPIELLDEDHKGDHEAVLAAMPGLGLCVSSGENELHRHNRRRDRHDN